MTELILFTTSGCHLCEEAEQMLYALQSSHDFSLVKTDIADSNELIELYGIRIPVVRNEAIQQEIGWPFQPEDITSLF